MAEELIKILVITLGIMVGVCAITIPLGLLLAKFDDKITKILEKIRRKKNG